MIAMALFMGFIITLSVNMIYSNDDALIEKDYYEKGQNYNKKFDAKQQAITDSVVPVIDINEYGLSLHFTRPAICKLNFKRLADAKMDTTFVQPTDEDFAIQVLEGELASGPWILTINYTIAKKSYIFEQEITMP